METVSILLKFEPIFLVAKCVHIKLLKKENGKCFTCRSEEEKKEIHVKKIFDKNLEYNKISHFN